MYVRKKVRPSSALGKLETYHQHSLYSEIRKAPSAKAQLPQQRAKTALAVSRIPSVTATYLLGPSEEQIRNPPEWLERELIKRRQRRHSLGLVENVTEKENLQNQSDPARNLRGGKFEQKVTLDQLQKLKKAFEEFGENGEKSLDVEKFKKIVKKSTGLRGNSDEQIEKLFMKIDFTATGKIHWNDFCTYLQLDYAELEELNTRRKKISFALPAIIQDLGHGEPILRIFPMPDNSMVVIREDGHIYFWSSQLKLRREKAIFPRSAKKMPKWVTDFTVMMEYNKLVLGTGDREIQLYEISNLEPYCQITGLETMPLRLDYSALNTDECMILYGDDQGCVNILLFTSVGETLRIWKKMPKPENNMATISIDNAVLSPNVSFIRWKVHGDWITQIKYYNSIKAVVSASNDESTAFVIGCTVGTTNVEQHLKDLKDHKDGKERRGQVTAGPPQKRASGDQTVFRVHKGVNTFAFCKKYSLVVTGGTDRIIRMWNLYVPGQPTGMLKGHLAPIFYVGVSAEDKIFSVDVENTVKIWDIQDHACLCTVHSKSTHIRGEVTACHYFSGIKALCVTTDSIALLQLKLKSRGQPHLDVTHKEPVLCCKYNKTFRQVVTCSERSVVKVWEFETGKPVFEFNDAHGDAAVTCITFDLSGRRMISGGRDGCVKIWNYNNGLCLHTLKRENQSYEICDCTYVDINRNKYIIAVGWDRRINMYIDSDDHLPHFREPQPSWQDDLVRGHREDILCIADNPPYLLASSSYDGEIIVWNMISGHIHCRLNIPEQDSSLGEELVDKSVCTIQFLKTRKITQQAAATLVSNGPQGSVNFWNLLHGGKLLARFTATKMGHRVCNIAVNEDNCLMYVADHIGYIYVYDIKDYALHGSEHEPAKSLNHWRAHVDTITHLEVIDEDHVILSSSVDCTVRLWSMNGEFIGTFGQQDTWEIFTPASWKHPMVPYEILIDPESMPTHPVLEGEADISELISFEEKKAKGASDIKTERTNSSKPGMLTITEEDIKEEIGKQDLSQVIGKRLRNERQNIVEKPLEHGGPTAYHTLKYFELANPVTCLRPDLSAAGTDPFQS
ncbi:cilia- and flagella-associated protein 337-like [Discoglossus pictus]